MGEYYQSCPCIITNIDTSSTMKYILLLMISSIFALTKHQDKVKEIREKYQDKVKEILEKYQDEIKKIREKYQEIRKKYQDKVKEIREKYQDEVKKIREKYQEIREKYQDEAKKIREKYQEIREKYQDEVKEIHEKIANGEIDWDAGVYEFSDLPDEDFVTTHTGLLGNLTNNPESDRFFNQLR